MSAALFLFLVLQTPTDDAKRAVDKTGATSYAFRVIGRFERSGESFPGGALVSRIDTYQSVRNGEKILVKGPEGLWKTPEERVGEATEHRQKDVADMMKTLSEAQAPHRMAAALLAEAAKVTQGDDVDVDGKIPCRVYFLTFPEKRTRDELKEQLDLAVKRGTLEKPDDVVWASMRGGAQIYVRAEDGLIARIVEHASVKIVYKKENQRPDEKKYELKLTLALSDYGATKLDLPVEVKEKIGLR